jgi:hypothetical protein
LSAPVHWPDALDYEQYLTLMGLIEIKRVDAPRQFTSSPTLFEFLGHAIDNLGNHGFWDASMLIEYMEGLPDRKELNGTLFHAR